MHPSPTLNGATRRALLLGLATLPCAGPARALVRAADLSAAPLPLELHQRLDLRAPGHERDIALTLDACSGEFDRTLIDTLVRQRVPATLFVTQRWLARQATAAAWLRAQGGLFEFQNHGAAHVPAVIGRKLWGMAGVADAAALEREVQGGAQAVNAAFGTAPRWFRGAGAAYDAASRAAIAQMGYRIAGFSVNGDGGATLPAAAVAARLQRAQAGDIVLAHMNHPRSGTAAGLATALPGLLARGLRFVTFSQAAGVVDVA